MTPAQRLCALLSLLVITTGGLFFYHQAMTAELIVLGAVAAFLVAVPVITRIERTT